MRAALLHTYGSPPEPGDRPEPAEAVNLVEVTAAPIVPLDLLCASGTSYFGRQPVPYVPGVQGCTAAWEAATGSGSRVVLDPHS